MVAHLIVYVSEKTNLPCYGRGNIPHMRLVVLNRETATGMCIKFLQWAVEINKGIICIERCQAENLFVLCALLVHEQTMRRNILFSPIC